MMLESLNLIIFLFVLWVSYKVATELLFLLNQFFSYVASKWNMEIELKTKELHKDEEQEEYQSTSCIGFQVDSDTDEDYPDECV